MASSYTGLGIEKMTTGENAGTWGSKTNTNLQLVEQLAGGYIEQDIGNGAQTTTLSVSDGSTGATLAHRIIKFTGTITGNQVVTIPLDVQQMYILVNGTSGAYTVQFKYVSGSGDSLTFATTDKGTKIVYAAADHASNPNIVDTGISTNTLTGVTGDITIDSPADLVLDAAGGNIEFKDAGTTQLLLDMDTTANAQIIQLKVNSDDLVFQQYDGNEVVRIADDRRLYFYDKGGEYIYGDGTDLNITSGADINIPSSIGLTFGDDGEKIEGDGTDLTITGNTINLTATTDVALAVNTGLLFAGTEKIESDGTDLSITVGGSGDINIGTDIGLTFGNDGEKIEGDGTDLTISGNIINLTAVADVVIPNSVGIQFGGASEKIEGDGTDLTISANNLTVDAAADIILDAAGNNLTFKSGGTAILDISNSSSDAVIQQQVNGYDIIFKQYDGNTLLTIDDAGFVGVHNAAAGPGELRIYEDTDNGVLYTGFKAPNVTTSITYVLPAADGSADYVMTTDGSGTLSWAAQTVSALAADNISAGDAAVSVATSSGDVTVDSNAGAVSVDGHTGVTLASSNSGDITLDSVADIVVDAAGGNVEFKDAGVLQLSLDMDTTAGVQIIKLGVNSDDLVFQQYDGNEVMRINDDRKLYFYDDGGENISSDGTDFTFASGNDINLTATTDINVPSGVGMTFGDDAEKIEGDGTDLTIAGNTINLTAVTDVVIPANVGVTFGSGEKIEGDSTDLTITSGAKINLTATSDVVIPANVGITFGTGEKIEGDSTDLTITSGADIGLTATADINVPSGVGMTFGDDGEKIEGDGTDLTIASSAALNLTATTDVVVPANVGITFGSGEKIEGDSTDLTITSGAKINLTATSDVIIPNAVGIQFGGASEKIEGDGTDLVISANNLTVDAAADIILDAAGNNVIFKSGGTSILDISNSSSDAVITSSVQDKDIIFKGDDGGAAVTALTLDMSAGGIATFSAAANVAQGALTSSSNAVAWDASDKPNAYHLTTENTTISAPTNAVEGAFICIEINHDGTTTVAWNAIFNFAADTAPTTTDTNAKTDILVFRYNGAIWQEVGRTLNIPES